MKLKLTLALTVLLTLGATCSTKVIEDSGPFAAEAGMATMILGGCERPLRMGHESCLYERGKELPELRLAFLNPAEYFVSDCAFGILKEGEVTGPAEVTINLSSLRSQLDAQGVCVLEVHAREYYPDPNDPSKRRMVPFIGGFFIRVVDPGFFPTPSKESVSWCYKVMRTNKGRTSFEECKP